MPRVAMVRAWRGRGLGCPLLQPADAMTTTALRGLVESTLPSPERQAVPPIGAVLIAQHHQALSGARCGTQVCPVCDVKLALLSPREERPPPLIVCDLPPVPRDSTEGDPAWSPACQA